jgi:hypothetical protein
MSSLSTGRPLTQVDITEEDAEYQEALRLQAVSTVAPAAAFWHWHGSTSAPEFAHPKGTDRV